MSNLLVALIAYFIDRIFGEFRFIKHPIIIIGSFISFFEDRFYKDSIFRGLLLVLFVLGLVSFISFALESFLDAMPYLISLILYSSIASMFLAHRMLYDSIKEILDAVDKKPLIAMLVSRDCENLNESDIYKASIETYAENLSDGVIAPLFYLSIFGLSGIIIYKAINTMDSMVGYRNKKYENFGKIGAILDDIANYIPSRITAILIMLIFKQKHIFSFYKDGKKHDSPNAGHPITAMAKGLDIALGGDTYYFGKLKHKAKFGSTRDNLNKNDLKKALTLRKQIDFYIFVFFVTILVLNR
ncbi:MAG: cobalamin biosynthesis protein CobD [Epsilonproteobacteria bacterium]|nr:cobalamin biosynthesis protein CobD [Campylobacterota bacterium]